MTEPAFRRPTQRQNYEIFQQLEMNFDKVLGAYKEGWSDKRIAEAVGVQSTSVSNLRNKEFGKLKTWHKTGEHVAKRNRFTDLEARVATLEAWVRATWGMEP